MKKSLRHSVISVFSVVILSSVALACECAPPTAKQSLVAIENAELIFEGRIVSLDTPEQPEEDYDYSVPVPVPQNLLYSKARIRILDLYKGAPEGEKVEAYIDTLTSCGSMLQIGDVTAFVLTRKDEVLVHANLCNMPNEEDWTALRAGQFKE